MKKKNNYLPIFLMISSCFFFSILGGIIKFLSEFIHPFEQAFFRNFFSIFLIVFFLIKFKDNPLRSKKKKLLFLRSIFGAITMLLLFWSYTLIPLSQAMAISFTTPLFIFLGGIIFLKESVSSKKITALLTGFIFTIIIIKPETELQFGTYVAIFASITHAITGLIVKDLTRSESVITIMFFMVIFMTPLSSFPLFFFWEFPENSIIWGYLFLLAIVGSLGNYCWTKALSISDLTNIMPFDFTKLIFATLIGYFFFNENLDSKTIICGIGIIICNIQINKHEKVKNF